MRGLAVHTTGKYLWDSIVASKVSSPDVSSFANEFALFGPKVSWRMFDSLMNRNYFDLDRQLINNNYRPNITTVFR